MSALQPYEIRQRRPFRCLLWIVMVALLTIAGQWYYHRHISAQQAELLADNKKLSSELTQLQTDFQALSQTRTSQQQLQAMHDATTAQLETRLQQLQQKVIDLNKELLFYQTVTQGTGSSELQIRELQLRTDSNDAVQLRYRLVLTQGENISEPISGEVIVALQVDADKTENAEIIGEHGLNLRYVQVIEGSFALPATTPAQLVVTLMQKNKMLTTRTFNWQEITPNGS
jgi:TolA-binding protein